MSKPQDAKSAAQKADSRLSDKDKSGEGGDDD